MCLLVLAWQAHPRYRLVVAANRDEYHARAAAALAPWGAPAILAGRDLQAGGTWLGMDRSRRFGVVTNFRDAQQPKAHAPSRGGLIPRYLAGAADAAEFLAQLGNEAQQYSGFNLLLADGDSLWYGCNRAERFARPLAPGVYGLSNEFLDTPWPKLRRVKSGFEDWLRSEAGTAAGLFALLGDRAPALEHAAREPSDLERALSAPFVRHILYGTRCSTVVLLEHDGAVHLTERRFGAHGESAGEVAYSLARGDWP